MSYSILLPTAYRPLQMHQPSNSNTMQHHSNANRRHLLLLLLALVAPINIHVAHAVTHPTTDSRSASAAAAPAAFQSIAEMPNCRSSGRSSGRALEPELQECSWSIQMKRGSARWYAFEIPADAAENMSVQIMARAVSGSITLALWGPGSDPYRSVPTQTGTNYMQWPGLRELDQDAAAAGGGHPSIASEQQYLFLARRDKPLLIGQYVVAVRADMGQPLVQIEVSTPSSMTQLVAEEQEALKDLISSCCQGLQRPDNSSSSSSSSNSTATPSAAGPATGTSFWCKTVGQAITYDLRQWYADICHVAPNVCDRAGHLRRLMIPPYALHCPTFPSSLGKFSRLQQVDISYSTAPGTLVNVAEVISGLGQLEQLHLRGIGLKGPLSCEVVQQSRRLQSLSLSDNNQLSGALPTCWFQSQSLQELQLAGLSGLSGPLPLVEGTLGDTTASGNSSATGELGRRLLSRGFSAHLPFQQRSVDASLQTATLQANSNNRYTSARPHARALEAASTATITCGMGQLKYINLAGVVGDAEQGLTGPLPSSLGLCKDLLYLDLSGHALSGALPPLPGQLQYVNLSSNVLSDVLPDFAGSPELQYLDLSYNRFRGSISDLTVLQHLDWLDLSDNELSGALPPLPLAVRWVDLSNNDITGDIDLNRQGSVKPGADAELMLVLLNLSHNKLSGTLPVSLAVAPHLSFLDLSFNQLLGDLNTFAGALKPTSQMLQVNLSYNRLVGGIPEQMQLLAALRPVAVTMSDGVTPVHRIMDLTHNQLSGVFPSWLITVVPQVQEACHCTLGVDLDAARFTCPEDAPQLNSRAQDLLRHFDQLQCVAGVGGQQVPIWQLVGPSYNRRSRQEHKELAVQQQQQQQQGQDAKHNAGTLAGVMVGVLAAAALVAAAVLVAVKRRRRQHNDKAVSALLHHFDAYHAAPDAPLGAAPSFEGMQTHPPHIRHPTDPVSPGSGSPASSGSLAFYTGFNLGFGNKNNSVSSSGGSLNSGQIGDGMCEIALVVKNGALGLSQADGGQGLNAKLKDRDGVV